MVILWKLSRVLKEKSKAPDCRLPGPSGLPIIGSAHQLNINRPHLTLTEMAHHHGPIYKMKLLTDHWIVVNTYDLAREVCVNKGREFSGRPESYRFSKAISSGHLYLFADFEDRKSALMNDVVARAMSLSGDSNKQIECVNQEMVRDLLDHWSDNGTSDSGLSSCRNDICRYVCRLLLKGIVGQHVDPYSTEVSQVMDLEHHMVNALGSDSHGIMLDLMPWLRYLGNKAWKNISAGFDMADAIYALHKPRILATMESDVNSAMHFVLKQAANGKNVEMTDDFTKGTMAVLLAASVTTTSTMMHVVVLALAEHIHIQERIQSEITNVIGNNLPGVQYFPQLPYTRAALLEILRYSSIVPLLLPHKAVCDTTLDGYTIPKGTNIFINSWKIHHDPEFWEDPFVYKPERFLTDDGQLLPSDHPKMQQIILFGGGPRTCPGEAFARRYLFLFMISLCQRFTFRLSGEGSSDPRTFELNGVINEPKICGINFRERS